MNLHEFKDRFDIILSSYLQEKTQQAQQLLGDTKLNSFVAYITTFVLSGGKRIRPYALWLGYRGFGGQQEEDILQFGIIFELLHSMALIHDDIIDQADKRHNIPTMHQHIASIIGSKHFHVAEGQAILLGDLLLSWVYELWNRNHAFAGDLLQQARENVHRMIEEVILGQMIDVDMMIGEPTSEEMIEKKNMYKTASYTFIRPMLTGALLAGANKEQQAHISKLGEYLGLAFQVKDDLADITLSDPTKSAFSDIQEGQQTIFTNYIFTKGSESDKQLLSVCMGKDLSEEEITALQTMFTRSGAIDAGKKLLQTYAKQANETLHQISFSSPEVIEYIEQLIVKIGG